MAGVWNAADIDVVSLASNHAMDWGPEALLDTIELFRGMGKLVIGAGRDGEEARTPAIVERNGVKIAILAYCSVLRDGQAAGKGKAGIAPMRAHTYYAPEEFQPGTPPRDHHHAVRGRRARRCRTTSGKRSSRRTWWSCRFTGACATCPRRSAPTSRRSRTRAIDAGADLILGHHAHSIKAVEVYKGKVCFYSIGNFMTTGARRGNGVGIFDWNLIWYQIEHGVPAAERPVSLSVALPQDDGAEDR